MTTLKVLQENWDSIEKKNGHAKGNQYSFYEWFLHETIKLPKARKLSKARCFLQFGKLADLQP